MARKTVMVSHLSGETIEEGAGAKVRISFSDARRGTTELDVSGNEPEVRRLIERGRKVARRGRRPKSAG
jgi:hypothetical protein